MLLIDKLLLYNSYFGQNMHKNALFLLKNCKIRPALGASPPGHLASNGWGLYPHIPNGLQLLSDPAKFFLPIENSLLCHCLCTYKGGSNLMIYKIYCNLLTIETLQFLHCLLKYVSMISLTD